MSSETVPYSPPPPRPTPSHPQAPPAPVRRTHRREQLAAAVQVDADELAARGGDQRHLVAVDGGAREPDEAEARHVGDGERGVRQADARPAHVELLERAVRAAQAGGEFAPLCELADVHVRHEEAAPRELGVRQLREQPVEEHLRAGVHVRRERERAQAARRRRDERPEEFGQRRAGRADREALEARAEVEQGRVLADVAHQRDLARRVEDGETQQAGERHGGRREHLAAQVDERRDAEREVGERRRRRRRQQRHERVGAQPTLDDVQRDEVRRAQADGGGDGRRRQPVAVREVEAAHVAAGRRHVGADGGIVQRVPRLETRVPAAHTAPR